jgi:CubicO group peptidase (beta-lactamase class C family)
VLSTKLAYRPGRGFIYSDLGADVLSWVVEAAAGEPLDRFVARRVYVPLGMRSTGFLPADSLRSRIAPTGTIGRGGRVMRGSVHDENAWALGGVAGHAGLFATASDLAVFAQMMLNGGAYAGTRIVADSTVRLFTARAAGSRALGWEIANGEHGAGDYFDEHAYGHTGFTGTSLWIDPDRDMFVVLLTNRVYAARVRRPSYVIADVRQDVADIAAMSVLDPEFAVALMPASFRADRAEGWSRRFAARTARPLVPVSTAAREAAERAAAAKVRAARRAAATKAAASRAAASRAAVSRAAASRAPSPGAIPTKSVVKR